MTVTKEWIPDANLRHFVRKQLNLPDEVPFTRQDMKRLMELTALDNQITILTTCVSWFYLCNIMFHTFSIFLFS